MGSGIAAHLANAGVAVKLLDVEKASADAAVKRQLHSGGFMDPGFTARVSTGSVSTDLKFLSEADWIIEAVAEKLDVKRNIYRAINDVRKPGSIVSSNTSTIPLHVLTAGLPESFCSDFLITHFFNPPRTMRLLELVPGERTRPEVTEAVRHFCDLQLGKSVVLCKDTPGFIANRIGTYWMIVAQNEAISAGLDVEEADAILGKPFGIPSTGIFGLLDLIGIDLIPTLVRSLQSSTPASDDIRNFDPEPPLVSRMISQGLLGRKSGAGFVRLSPDRKTRDVLDLKSGEYRPSKPSSSESLNTFGNDVRKLMEDGSTGGKYASSVMERTLAYAASLVPEISESPYDVDEAMRTGYGWKYGPFELIDQLGADWLVHRLAMRKAPIPAYLQLATGKGGFHHVENRRRLSLAASGRIEEVSSDNGRLTLADARRTRVPVRSWRDADLLDIGDSVACFELRTKMNTFNPEVLDALVQSVEICQRDFKALVIASDASAFSAGADLRVFLDRFQLGGRNALGDFIDQGHRAFDAVKYAPFPVIGAAAGLALGGGCELLLHCDAIQAHSELSMGLVETRIGIIPGWGGCKEMLQRFSGGDDQQGDAAPASALRAFELIATARVSNSAFDARALGFLRTADAITMNRSRLLMDAKQRALEFAEGYVPPVPPTMRMSGASGYSAIEAFPFAEAESDHDRRIRDVLAGVLCGNFRSEEPKLARETDMLSLERQAFLNLFETPESLERVAHMLKTGKALLN